MLRVALAFPLAAFDAETFGAGVVVLALGLLLWTPYVSNLLTNRPKDAVPGMSVLVPKNRLGLRIFGTILIVIGLGGLGAGFAA